jgi:aminotransferase
MNDSKSRRDFIADHLKSVPRSGIRDFFEIVSTRQDIISLSIGEPDFTTPWHIREAAIYALDRGATAYTANLGLLELRRRIADYMRASFAADYDPAREILVTVGVSEALDLALRATLNPGDEVLYHEPCYVSYAPVVRFAHGVPTPVTTRPENGFRLTRALLEERVTPRTRVLLLNYPNNPTGAALTPADVREIAAFAREHGLLVITDEIYSELTYENERASIAAEPGMKERTIFLNGFSKAWAMTGFRVGYACAPPALLEAMMKIHQYTMLCAPVLSQKAAIEALRNGAADLAAMRDAYRLRRNWLHSSLEEIGLPCARPQGAFYAFPHIGKFGLTSREFALRFLEEENVACVPGDAFGVCGEGFLRCAYAADLDDIKEALRRLAVFVKRL